MPITSTNDTADDPPPQCSMRTPNSAQRTSRSGTWRYMGAEATARATGERTFLVPVVRRQQDVERHQHRERPDAQPPPSQRPAMAIPINNVIE